MFEKTRENAKIRKDAAFSIAAACGTVFVVYVLESVVFAAFKILRPPKNPRAT